MKRLIVFGFLVLSCGDDGNDNSPPPPPPPQQPQNPTGSLSDFTAYAQPIFQRSCFPCHSGANPQSGVSFQGEQNIIKNFSRADRRIRDGTMPPASSGKPRISENERATMIALIANGG